MKTEKIKVFFSIDLEEWWGVESFRKYFSNKSIPSDDRIKNQLNSLLNYLKENDVICHFFILGRVAEKFPESIKSIIEFGHEIGTHGYAHKLIYNQTPEEFEEDLKKSIYILENITQQKVISYRAPSYSITKDTLWALPILQQNGILYDSSIVPTKNQRFGIKNSLREPFEITFDNGDSIKEIPPNTIHFGSYSLPLSSGFAFRLFPTFVIKLMFKKFMKKSISQPQIILHNWEFDSEHPSLKVSITKKIIHYYNLKQVKNKLKKLFKDTEYIGLSDIQIQKKILYKDVLNS